MRTGDDERRGDEEAEEDAAPAGLSATRVNESTRSAT